MLRLAAAKISNQIDRHPTSLFVPFFSFTFSFVLSITTCICLGTCTKSSRRRCPRSRNTVFEQVEFSTTEALQPCSYRPHIWQRPHPACPDHRTLPRIAPG